MAAEKIFPRHLKQRGKEVLFLMSKLSIFGAGSWGTALAHVLSSNGHDICLWCRRSQQARAITATGKNPDYLSSVNLSPHIMATSSLAEAAIFSQRWILAVPSQGVRHLLEELKPLAPQNVKLCNLAKGVEISSGKLLNKVCHEALPGGVYSVLSGPSHAEEVVQGLPTAVSVASTLLEEAFEWQVLIGKEAFRIYTSQDVTGVEIGGAMKNVIAIAAGASSGMSLGDNAKATLITRGLAEILRLGIVLGGNPLTFSGLAGAGDLMVTCYSEHFRNFRLGKAIGEGMKVEEALASLGQVAEGYYTAKALESHRRRYGVELPISTGVYRVLYEGASPHEVLEELLLREQKPELSPEMVRKILEKIAKQLQATP